MKTMLDKLIDVKIKLIDVKIMTPKDKASDLVCDFYEIQSNEYDYGINWDMAKQCSLVAVDEIIKALNYDIYIQGETDIDSHVNYWQRVKNEIEQL